MAREQPRRQSVIFPRYTLNESGGVEMSWLRPIDLWFGEKIFVFQAIHRSYARKLMRNEHEAEDLVQEAYARLFRLENWTQILNPHAFTMRILHNLAVERFRRADFVRIEQAAALQFFDPADDAPGPDAAIVARSQLALVARVLDGLPERCREAIYLRRIKGLSPPEVAEKMQISVSTVEKHLTKGLRLLMGGLRKLETGGEIDARPRHTHRAGRTYEWYLAKNRENH
jgi:RNA polymerase sigma-70 factor (ECF subfamily)